MTLTIGKRIGLGFTAVLFMVTVLLAVYEVTLTRSGNQYRKTIEQEVKIGNLALEVNSQMLQLRRNEKDFLLRLDLKYRDRLVKGVEHLKKETQEMISLARQGGHHNIVSDGEKILKHIEEYKETFLELSSAWEVRGLDHKSGQQGAFRSAVHTLGKLFVSGKKNGNIIANGEVLLLTLRKHEKDYLLRDEEKYVKSALKTIQQLEGAIRRSALEKSFQEKVSEGLSEYHKLFLGLVEQNKKITELIASLRAAVHKVEPLVEKIHDNSLALVKSQVLKTVKSSERSALVALLLGIAAIVIGILSAVLITRKIVGLLTKVSADLESSSHQVTQASNQLSEASQSLAQASSQQASSTEETSASLEELAGMVQNIVGHAESSSDQASEMRKQSQIADEAMRELHSSIEEIKNSNERIQKLADVIDQIAEKTAVIDEIVFQTKLLSFNASVEAERAGEHGRGFAVVAQEVGSLAQMSGKAALEISSIVKESISSTEEITDENQKRVEKGESLAKQTFEILKTIMDSSEKVHESTVHITSASKEQSSGIQQINSAMTQLDHSTQQNAATSEETASSGEELSAQAENLRSIVAELNKMVRG